LTDNEKIMMIRYRICMDKGEKINGWMTRGENQRNIYKKDDDRLRK
jgi:hypothetical protein